MNRGPAISSEPGPLPTPSYHPLPSFHSFFFVSSSFLIAANRDVKTIRALSVDSVPMLIFFLCPLSLPLFLPPFLVYDIYVHSLKYSFPFSILYIYIYNVFCFLRVLEIDERYFEGAESGKRGVDFLVK